MPRILGNPVTFEEIEWAKKSNLKFVEVAGLEEPLGDDGLFEDRSAVIASSSCQQLNMALARAEEHVQQEERQKKAHGG